MARPGVGRGPGAARLAWGVACLCTLACTAASGGEAVQDPCAGIDCSGHGSCASPGGTASCRCDPGYVRAGATACAVSVVPAIGGCPILPADHLFNTPVDDLPVDPHSGDYLATIGAHHLHLDLGQDPDPTATDYWGIPYNVVHGAALSWTAVAYGSPGWDPRAESDCAALQRGAVISPCTTAAAPTPVLPIAAAPLVEGGLSTDAQASGDHHLLLLDADACFLWELYHAVRPAPGWEIFGSAGFDLGSNALRPEGWTSADAAGFPILPLLLRADEAGAGTIRHALRFTIQSSKIRAEYTWPARHLTTNGGSSTAKPPMGQLFRLRAGYAIPAGFHVQSRAILQAMKTYGMYVADGGSDMYVQGEPSAGWSSDVFAEVQSVSSTEFEAVDLGPIRSRAGFDPDSARVPP